MPDPRYLLGVCLGAAAVLGVGGLGTYLLSGTESTTALDAYDTVTVDGHKALAPNIVAGRTQSKYHPLPWVGTKVEASCPEGLKAVAGTTLHCTGTRTDGSTVDIPVTVVEASDTHVTWRFSR